MKVLRDVPLAPLTTLQVGGRASYFAEATCTEEVLEAYTWARSQNLPLFPLGSGSNLLVSDDGFEGLVLKISLKGITVDEDDQYVTLTAAAGEVWDKLVAQSVDAGWAGIECLSGIPGSCGATPIQNVGAYGQEVCQTITCVSVYDKVEQKQKTLPNSECRFEYRSSIFKKTDRYVVLSVTYKLQKDSTPTITYPELKAQLTQQPTLKEVRAAVLALRRRKSMIVDATDINSRSAGSFFINPVVDASFADALRHRYPNLPTYPLGSAVKLPAAWLIEQAGFKKGYRRSRAAISSNHALAIVNLGGATAAEIIALMKEIQDKVEQTFGIILQPEPVFLGFEPSLAR
ncbi:MAG: UDP-N-acetylmuramate dehydrogenase [Acidobacteriota bacterium]|nr:UDP-N-acetylmuramate dehydrogenase [Blastocatellia bacterium]MDW8412889.1 UDP-N-acetylmuramate dehydrogenase [Acidobacteriota bacterium]